MPSYSDRDPKGWHGDPKRGAAMGRVSLHNMESDGQKFTLRRIRLNMGGYDSLGCYFGIGAPLYWCASDDGKVDYVFRVYGNWIDPVDLRNRAKETVREKYPNALFYR